MARVTITLPTELGFGDGPQSNATDDRTEVGGGERPDQVPVIVRWHACWAGGAA